MAKKKPKVKLENMTSKVQIPKEIIETLSLKSIVIPKEPPPSPPSNPVVCMGCKGIYDSSIMKVCSCKGNPAYCPACAEAGTCHRCGKKLE